MSNIKCRLRERAGHYDEYDWHREIELEAADEIERLEKNVRLLTEILELEFAKRRLGKVS